MLLDRRLFDGDSPGAAGWEPLRLRQGDVELARIHVLRIVEEEGVVADRLPGARLVEPMHLDALLEVAKRCLDAESIDRTQVFFGVDRELDLEAAIGEWLEPRLFDRKRPSHASHLHDRRPTEDPRHLRSIAIDDTDVGKAAFSRRRHL